MKTNTSEKEFLKIKKFRIKSKNIETKKKMMQNEIKFKEEKCKKLCNCETEYN